MTGMCVDGTPVEDHRSDFGLWVKREDACCPGGPNFSKTRGVYAHALSRPERIIGVLDTNHSQGGWAVARACKLLDKQCHLWYPVRKAEQYLDLKPQQLRAEELGAVIHPLPAGRSAVLYHAAKSTLSSDPHIGTAGSTYMFPNALKLPEMVSETAAEVRRTHSQVLCAPCAFDTGLNHFHTVLVSASSGTIAAGVARGLLDLGWTGTLIVHQGYSRPQEKVRQYMRKMSDAPQTPTTGISVVLVDEGYTYADEARPGPTPPFACNKFYDLKAFRWWMARGRAQYGDNTLMWNIG